MNTSLEYIVILSLWKRAEWLEEQIDLFINQTVPPKEVWVCHGLNSENSHFLEDLENKVDKILTIEDGGSVFSRFEMARDSKENLFFIIDDDMFPTENYCEKCLHFYERFSKKEKDCIIGSSGRIFKTDKYFPNTMLGSVNYSNFSKVDIGTNGWFLSRESIKCMLESHITSGYNNCEDIALSYLNRNKRGVDTYVIKQGPHINSDKYRHARGFGEEALSHQQNHVEFYKQRNEVLKFYKTVGAKNEA